MRRGDAQFHGTPQFARGHGIHRAMGPWKELAAESGSKKARNHAHILHRNAKRLRHHHAMIHDALRGLIHRQVVAIPYGDRGVQLYGLCVSIGVI